MRRSFSERPRPSRSRNAIKRSQSGARLVPRGVLGFTPAHLRLGYRPSRAVSSLIRPPDWNRVHGSWATVGGNPTSRTRATPQPRRHPPASPRGRGDWNSKVRPLPATSQTNSSK